MPTTASVRPRDAQPVLLFFICLTIIALIGQTWWAIVQDHRLTVESEKRHSIANVRGFSEHANRILEQVDHVIADASEGIGALSDQQLADRPAIRNLLIREKSELQFLSALWVLNLKGTNWATSATGAEHTGNLKDRPYRFLSQHPDHKKAVIGLAIRDHDNEWVIPVARNLYDRRGTRIGMIGASIRLVHFVDFYTRMTRDTPANVTMRTNDGFLLFRSPFNEAELGQDLSKTPVTKEIEKGPSEGSFDARSVFENQHRLFSWHRNTRFSTTIIYALDMDTVQAAWKARSVDRILFAGATILFSGILGIFLLIHIRRLRESERGLASSESRYRILFEGANDPILLLNRDQVYVDCNQAAMRLFGVGSKADIIGKSAGHYSPAEQPSRPSSHLERQRLIDAALDGKPQQVEWVTLRDGQSHFNELTLSRADLDVEPLVFCIFRDIDARRQADELQAGQNKILHMIANGLDLQRILNEIIAFIEKHAPHSQCMMVLLNEQRSAFTWGAGPNIPQDLMQTLTGMEVRDGNGICSEVVRTQYPVVVDSIASHPAMQQLQHLYANHDFQSCGSWPIMGKSGQILGAFTMLFKTRRVPSAQDVQLVGISTDLAGIAIEGRWAEERIRHLAHYDELTGLPNRFLYIQYLKKALIHAERAQSQVGVLFLDLDRFKNINDTFGHDAGDKVLCDLSRRFRACLRESDTIARIGGDEFIVLVEDYADPRHLADIAQRLMAEASKPLEIDGQECQLSASIGIATYPGDGDNKQVLLKNADIAMYRAKSNGKNNYQFYSAEMNTHTVERAALETRLRRAIERREFVVYYQPKVDVLSGIVVGAEALVRWQHPEQGILPPAAFIALAEEAGMIGQIGMLVLENACRDIVGFRDAGISFGRVAINLSGSQFNDINLLTHLKSWTQLRRMDPSSLEFEITESTVMHNRDQAIEMMDEIRKLGFSLSIDDFGTGYSSLAYLKRFPVDSVKVDKSFVNDIPHDANDSAIVQAIIVMAHTLGLKVTAEGVENKVQLETLQKFGCDEYQGYYFSKAIPACDFIALVQEQTNNPNKLDVQDKCLC